VKFSLYGSHLSKENTHGVSLIDRTPEIKEINSHDDWFSILTSPVKTELLAQPVDPLRRRGVKTVLLAPRTLHLLAQAGIPRTPRSLDAACKHKYNTPSVTLPIRK